MTSRDASPTGSFFDSRWVTRPAHVCERPRGGLPLGFRAGAAAAGIKPSGDPDVGLLVCGSSAPSSAARFTRSGVLAAPVVLSRQARLDGLRAVAVNAGNANAATGDAGTLTAQRMQLTAADVAGVPADTVAVASTGVIGVPLDGARVARGLRDAGAALGGDATPFAAAILTTDARAKHVTLDVELPSGPVTLSAQAKGAGMIQPSFATLLCFVQTDAALSAQTADLLLGVCVKRSFDRISVDGQLSTNDTAILMCSGASGVGVAPETDDERRLGEALDVLLRRLAVLIVADGEGSRRVGRVLVNGGGDGRAVEHVARSVANSPLVKAALHGGDPNWGRIAQAVGAALPDSAPLLMDIAIEGEPVCAAGAAVPHDAAALAAAVAGDEVDYEVTLPGARANVQSEVFFSDLSHEYVSINADYTT